MVFEPNRLYGLRISVNMLQYRPGGFGPKQNNPDAVPLPGTVKVLF